MQALPGSRRSGSRAGESGGHVRRQGPPSRDPHPLRLGRRRRGVPGWNGAMNRERRRDVRRGSRKRSAPGDHGPKNTMCRWAAPLGGRTGTASRPRLYSAAMRRALLDLYRACLLGLYGARWGAIYLAHLPRWPRWPRHSPHRLTASYCLRRLIEDMGVTFVKLGQFLAIRYDLLPAAVCRELSNLLNEVPPLGFEAVRAVVEAELGRPLGELFASFEPTPLGSASIAQVHRARAHDGHLLAIKVQRPGAETVLRSDIRNLLRLSWLADRFHLLGSLSMTESVREVADFTLREIDFLNEGRTAERVRREAPPFVHVPEIRWDLTTRRVLAMELVEGKSLLAVCERAEAGDPDAFSHLLPGVDPQRVMADLARACLDQLFTTGVFHGDPHPANIIVGGDGRIAFVDFGIFGELPKRHAERLAALLGSLAAGRLEAAYRCYMALATPTEETDLPRFRREMLALLGAWYGAVRTASSGSAGAAERLAAHYQMEVFQLMRRHRLRTEPDQLLFWRTLTILDATAYRLPVEFDLLAAMNEFFRARQQQPAERAARRLADPERVLGLADLLVHAAHAADAIHAGGRGERPLRVVRRPRLPSAGALAVKPIVLVLLAISTALLALGPAGGALGRFLAAAVAASCAGAAVFWSGERRRL